MVFTSSTPSSITLDTNMHVHFEECGTTRSDCSVQALSWMGKVPETVPDEDGWKLNRLHYYQEGWLASGNMNGIIGVTFTACHCKKNFEQPTRSNFNLRGHRNEVALVKWNEPYQKLATCDVTGVIFVWIKHEGRWSIELINDRNSQVTDFAWSHDGRMALICYRDGFVLVGSVAGQRYWSTMLNLDGCTIACGIWSPDDQKVMFGTTDGQVIVMSANGAMLAQVTLVDGTEITAMAWSCEKFYLDEREGDANDTTLSGQSDTKTYTLAVCFKSGVIYLLFNYDDVCPRVIHTGLTGVKMEWCNDGELLAVTGFIRMPDLNCANELRFYTADGHLRYSRPIPHLGKPASALTWGHNNKRLFVAVGSYIYTAWVTRKVALLQFLCRRTIHRRLRDDTVVPRLPLPTKLRNSIAALFSPTVKGYIPDPLRLREFVCMPPPGAERLHCTMIRHGEETSGGHYMLYLEYLGGLIPLLKGKRASKIRPEFVIFDPKIKTGTKADEDDLFLSSDSATSDSDSDKDVVVDGCGSPRMQRKKRLKRLRRRVERRDSSASQRPLDELLYDDNLPETHKLVEVTSNLWGTKFKLHGLASFLPEDLGHILYKTSLLHLQPRQMTVSLLELTPDLHPQIRDPSYNPNHFSESDDDVNLQRTQESHRHHHGGGQSTTGCHVEKGITISPEVYCTQPSKLAAHSSSETIGGPGSGLENGAIEVPVIIERHSVFQNGKPERSTSNCSPFEIRSLDGSPPQRRSPSLKSRSLSPAEQQVTYTSNAMLDGSIDNDMFTREVYLDKGGGPKVRMNTIYQLNSEPGGSTTTQVEVAEVTTVPGSPRSVVQLAAKRLEDVLAIQRQTPAHNEVNNAGSSGHNSLKNNINNSTSSSDRSHSPSYHRHSSNSSDGQSPPDASFRTDTHRVSMIESLPPSQAAPPPRWADKACQEIKFIDDDLDDAADSRKECREAVFCTAERLSARDIMTSTQVLAELDSTSRVSRTGMDYPDNMINYGGTLANTTNSIELHKKRLILAPPPENKEHKKGQSLRTRISKELQNARNSLELIPRCDRAGVSESYTDVESLYSSSSRSESPRTSVPSSPTMGGRRTYEMRRGSLDMRRLAQCHDSSFDGVDSAVQQQSASLPTSPVRRIVMPQQKRATSKQDISKSKLVSPFLKRRLKSYKAVDSSDEEILLSGDDVTTSENYKNLETFQKAQLNKKLRKVRTSRPDDSRESVRRSPSLTRKRHFVMHNKAPLWNENSQVYQLDFGGRVTQESAKNFQIEFRGKQVMQFGRIDGNAYTLDFQYPFSAIQAFAVALANVTQRLK